MTVEQSELREKIAREIRLAMVDNPTAGTFRERQDAPQVLDHSGRRPAQFRERWTAA